VVVVVSTGYLNCKKCLGTGQWVAPISRYGAPSRCPDCYGTGNVEEKPMPTADKPRGKVERTFDLDKRSFRVVSVGKHSAGYQDSIMLQEREVDEVGGERWMTVVAQDSSDNDNQFLLLKIIANAKLS
jgi:hypothetical protein